MPSSILESKCPVCSSTRLTTLREFSSEGAAQHFVCSGEDRKRHQDLAAHIEKLWGGSHCAIRQCLDCEFGFSDPYVAGDMLFYDLAYPRIGFPTGKWEYSRTVGELARLQLHANRVLEVGSGYGFFLDKIADVYVSKSGITALEFDGSAVSTLRAKGYAAIQDDIRAAEIDAGVDAIFLFQVLEHMDNLDSLFDRLSSLLRDGGLLFVAVPNPRKTTFNEQNGGLLDTPPNHIGRWTERALSTVGKRHSFRLDRYEIEPFSLKNFALEDFKYSYQRTSQEAGTLASWSRSHKSARYGKLLAGVVALAYAPRRLTVWRKAAQTGNLGGSAWARFTKSAASIGQNSTGQ
jgi:SAM-dependent methyltransferase